MITITRSLVRQLRSVIRRARVVESHGSLQRAIVVLSGSDGLRIRTMSDQMAIEFHEPGEFASEELVVSAEFLAASESRTDDVVTLESLGDEGVRASWSDHGIPQILQYGPVVGASPATGFPSRPESFEQNSQGLLSALQAASAVVPADRTRFALDCLQLRGIEGKIVATDGGQALVQAGFRFPWSEDLLVPASRVFSARELFQHEFVGVGVVPDWVAFKMGHWTIWLRIDRDGRFPKVDDLIRNSDAAATRLSIESRDAQFLASSLSRLPGDEAVNRPITLCLNGQVVLRSKAEGQSQATEFVLSRSTSQGESLIVNSDREFLARAIQLGFREVSFFGPSAPALCDDGRRQYLWALLGTDGAIRSGDNPIRVESADCTLHEQSSHPKPPRRRFTVTQANKESEAATAPNASDACPTPTKPPVADPQSSTIGQAIALRAVLRETLAHTNELIRVLKREKRQSRLVASTLASLKQLQKVA